ncbi:uncharacterized protein PG998_007790 [Apiospora kogelbergensis]|uniref:EKC/KEOPS complex subunit BUD32 n=1 Tax=Apiospora kogelbergensis TaxID=1337665 RepID=A0AAW0QHX7_9PEZI
MAKVEITFTRQPCSLSQPIGQVVHTTGVTDNQPEETVRRYQPLDDPEDLEDVEHYKKGGYHPVHLGDLLDDRFEVFHKLGYGPDATVWLCLDNKTQDWRAVKIMLASLSSPSLIACSYLTDGVGGSCAELRLMQHLEAKGIDAEEARRHHIMVPDEIFQIMGPNGTHLCFVLSVLGPSILSKLNVPVAHGDLLQQVAEGIQFLHHHGVRHGDVRPQNMLLRLRDDGFAKDDMDLLLGLPELEKVRRAISDGDGDGDRDPGPHAPRYLVRPTSLEGLGVEDEVVVVDSGGYYHNAEGAPMHPDLPLAYAAPEVVYASAEETVPRFESDVWALGCTIAELRCGKSVLGIARYGGGEEKYLEDLEYLFGPLPDLYRRAKEPWVDGPPDEDTQTALTESDERRCDMPSQPLSMTSGELVQSRKDSFSRSGRSCPIEAAISQERHWFNFPLDAEGEPDQSQDMVAFSQSIPESEVPELGDLLRKVLKYNPSERISIEEILQHQWFQGLRDKMRASELRDSVSASSSPLSPKLEPLLWRRETEQGKPKADHIQTKSPIDSQPTKSTFFVDRMLVGAVMASLCWATALALLTVAGLRFEWVRLGQIGMVTDSQQLLQLSHSEGQLHLPVKAASRSPIECNCVIS